MNQMRTRDLIIICLLMTSEVWGAIYLVMHDHPWFALLLLLGAANTHLLKSALPGAKPQDLESKDA